ncbi:MAG: CHASE3 domain-containing protein [Microcystaceae cyanobacterium]
MNIRKILPIGFGSVLFVVMVQNIIFQQMAKQLRDSAEWVAHTYNVQFLMKDLEKTLVDAETGQRGFIYTGQDNFLEPYNDALSAIDNQFEFLKETVSDNPPQVQRLNQTQDLVQKKFDELKETINLKKQGKEAELRKLVLSGLGKQIMDDIRSQILEMIEIESKLLDERTKAADRAYLFVTIVAWIGAITVLLIGIIILRVINNIAIQPIERIVNVLSSSAHEMAASVEQQQRTSSSQASSVNETTSTMDELGASSTESCTQADQADMAAQQALKVAGVGNEIVAETLNRMIDLKEQVEKIATQITSLSKETNQIGSISQLVSNVANDTNMLAINASVEAVHAGEDGKRFSIVASEIRKLSDQTKESAQEINTLVANIQNSLHSTVVVTDEGTQKVNTGMEITQKTTKAFEEIIEAVNNVVINNQGISLNTKQQGHAITQVLQSMDEINKGAGETVHAMTQIQQTANELNNVASELKTII